VYLRGEASLSVSQLAAKGAPVRRSAATNTTTLEGEFAVQGVMSESFPRPVVSCQR